MKEKILDILFSVALMSIGFFCKISFSAIRYTTRQVFALSLFGIGIVLIVHNMKIDDIYKLSIVMVAGLWLPNIVRSLGKAGDSSEEKASKKISDKIDKFL